MINVKYIACAGGGFAIGVIVGILTEVAYEKMQDRKAQAEYDRLREAAEEISYVYSAGGATEEGTEFIQSLSVDSTKTFELDEPKEKVTVDYSSQYKPYEGSERVIRIEEERETIVEDIPSEQLRSKQEIITEQDYYIPNGFEKVECTYAQTDDGVWILTNDVDNEEMNVAETIGIESLKCFTHIEGEGEPSGVMFVRNALKGTDYFVTKFEYEA